MNETVQGLLRHLLAEAETAAAWQRERQSEFLARSDEHAARAAEAEAEAAAIREALAEEAS